MDRRTKWIAGGAVALVVIGGGTGVAIATGAADNDEPLTGSTLDQARTAALEYTGGGTVIESEAGDDGAAYGVEIRLEDGRFIDVRVSGPADGPLLIFHHGTPGAGTPIRAVERAANRG